MRSELHTIAAAVGAGGLAYLFFRGLRQFDNKSYSPERCRGYAGVCRNDFGLGYSKDIFPWPAGAEEATSPPTPLAIIVVIITAITRCRGEQRLFHGCCESGSYRPESQAARVVVVQKISPRQQFSVRLSRRC